MNNKAFTLVELLGVLIILSIIAYTAIILLTNRAFLKNTLGLVIKSRRS